MCATKGSWFNRHRCDCSPQPSPAEPADDDGEATLDAAIAEPEHKGAPDLQMSQQRDRVLGHVVEVELATHVVTSAPVTRRDHAVKIGLYGQLEFP